MRFSINMFRILNEIENSKNRILDYLEIKRDKIIFILICCYILGNSTNNYTIWKNELFGILNKIPKFAVTNKYLTYKQLYKWDIVRWNDSLYDHLKSYISEVKFKENIRVLDNIDRSQLCNFILDYFTWLYTEFEIDGAVSIEEVYNEVDLLMNDYTRKI